MFGPHCYIAIRSKVRVKVKGRGQGHGSSQRSRSNFWRIAVDVRGSALRSAAKTKEESLTVHDVCLCVE